MVMHLDLPLYEQQIATAQEKLKITDPLVLPPFAHKGFERGNQLVKIDPFFYLPQTTVEQLKNEFIPFRLTTLTAFYWLQCHAPQIEKELAVSFGVRLKQALAKTKKRPKNQLLLIKNDLLTFLDTADKKLEPLVTAFVKFLDSKYCELNIDLPVYDIKGIPHHFSLDLLLLNKSHPRLWHLLKKHTPKGPSVIFKVGLENIREGLAHKLATSLQLDKFLLTKKEITLKGIQVGKTVDPTGLACPFIGNEADRIWQKGIKRYLYLQRLVHRQANKESKVKHWQQCLSREVKKLDKLQMQESIEGNLLLDLIFGSYDSHINQYKIQEGLLVNLDFSRFGLPCESYRMGERTYATLCSSLLDNPYVEKPLSSQTQDLIKSWDLNKIKQTLESYVGLKEEFLEGTERMRSLRAHMYALVVAHPKRIPFKFFMTFGKRAETMTLRQQKKLIRMKYIHEATCLKKRLFQKLHPEALQAIVRRIELIQQALHPGLSSKDLFARLYPQLLPFFEFLKPLVISPGLGLAFKPGRRSLEQVSMEEIASHVSIKLNKKEALPALYEGIKNMRRSSLEQADLSMIAELYF